MDTVILAGGKGSRLDGLVAPYHKPLVVINGKSLIARAVMLSLLMNKNAKDRVIVVGAPENASPLSHMIGDARLLVQTRRRTLGPGGALWEALDMVETKQVLIMMADNVISPDDVRKVAAKAETSRNVIGVRDLPDPTAFTRRRRDGYWVEKVPLADEDVHEGGCTECWVGPLILDTNQIFTTLDKNLMPSEFEMPIGPRFNQLTDVETVQVETYDIGTMEAWT